MLKKLAESIWFWRATGGFGCLFMFTWTAFSLILLVDTVFTGASEWAPWAVKEAASRTEFIISYIIMLSLGVFGSVFLVRWVWPFLKSDGGEL